MSTKNYHYWDNENSYILGENHIKYSGKNWARILADKKDTHDSQSKLHRCYYIREWCPWSSVSKLLDGFLEPPQISRLYNETSNGLTMSVILSRKIGKTKTRNWISTIFLFRKTEQFFQIYFHNSQSIEPLYLA